MPILRWMLLTSIFLLTHAYGKTSLEEKYIKDRNLYISRLKGPDHNDKLDAKALKDLEGQLKKIIGPSRVTDFSSEGLINLETLQQELGYDKVDGLRFLSKDEVLFISTEALIKDYILRHPQLPKDISKLSTSDLFYTNACSLDSAYTIMAEIPLKDATAVLALSAQDIGPFPPQNLLVFKRDRDRILILQSFLRNPPKISECEEGWKKSITKNASPETYDKAFSEYQNCWKKNAKDQSFYKDLVLKANAMAGQLQKK